MKILHQNSTTCVLIIVTLIGIFWGCKKTERLATPPPPATTVTASVAGNIIDLNNAPVSGALVAAGVSTTTTDANGQFTLKDIELYKDAGFVKVTKAGYLTGSRTFFVNANTTNNIKIQLLPKTVSGTIASSSGGNIDVAGGAKINFTASSFVNAAGNTSYTGDAAVAGYYLNPADPNFREYMPGDLRGVSTTNKEGILKTFGMLSVEINDAGGQKLQLAAGKTATITIPISSAMQAAAPATISLWYFDETKGIWKEEGTATKQGTNYVGIVSHFSFWNAGEQGADVQLDATFKHDSLGVALTNKLVHIISVNFGTTNGYTDNNGKISGLVPANEALGLKILDDCGQTIFGKNIGPFSTNTDLGTINVPWRTSCFIATVTVSGTVVNCNNAAVTNGYVQVTTGNSRFTNAINNGSFSIAYSYASNSGAGTLTAYDVNSGDSSMPLPINISGGNININIGQVRACQLPSPVAGFSYSVGNTNLPVTVTFNNTSTNATSWLWNFGDGTSSSVQNPVHSYTTAGDFPVSLKATGPGGPDSILRVIHISGTVDSSYINLTMQGTTYTWVYPNIDAFYSADSLNTHIIGSNNNWIHFYTLNDNASPGNYNIILSATINGRSYQNNNATTTITEYGSVGGNIIGTGSGQLADSTSNIPFSLAYKVKRNR